ncbi:MAG: DUF1127 domain-containing protein [Alphaproteobacteria bacterium]|nr:DUF1127 domain-containing protein [Alphaproteobacteria bacterium]
MAVERYIPARPRPCATSALPRRHPLAAIVAAWHDAWLARRAAARGRQELAELDPRILRDIGLEPWDARRLTQANAVRAESTIPPQSLPGLAKLAHHLEG